MQQDTSKIKERIINYLRVNGPSLPVHIAKEIGMDILFASAFLSELLSERKIKTSHMKVGNSKIHLLPGQEPKLENFYHHLKSREKDAFLILKEKKILKDSEIEPAIRVAIRKIKDFAVPYETSEGVVWRYFSVPEEELKNAIQKKQEQKTEKREIKNPEGSETKKTKSPQSSLQKRKKTKKQNFRKNERFFARVKEFLLKNQFEITGIESFNKNELVLKVKKNEEEYLFIAFNKKRILEKDIIKAGKKAEEYSLKYILSCLGEPAKKIRNLIDAVKNLSEISRIN